MNNNIKKSLRTGMLLATGFVAISSCTDTWDNHYNAVGKLDFNGTTMQAVEKKASDFAKIVKAYGYERELNSDNVYTVWAPANGSFNVSDYLDSNGKMYADSADVVKEFIKNHIARYAHSFTQSNQTINLMNNKPMKMTSDGKFGGATMTEKNLSCKNGVLHVVDATIPYNFNLFEYIAKQYKNDDTPGKDTLSLYQFLYDPKVNKDTLIENKSVSSGVDENGDKIWVDSFVMRNNTVLKTVDAKLYEEDSSFIAIIPTAKAWGERRKFAESLLNFSPAEDARSAGACDSLKNHYADRFAMTDLFFNKNANEHWQDSLKSTTYGSDWRYNVYYSKMPKYLPEDREVNDILAKSGQKIECSNGDAYVVDEYPMSIYEQFFKPIRVRGSYDNVDLTLDTKGNPAYTKNSNFSSRSSRIVFTSTDSVTLEKTVTNVDYSHLDVIPTTSSANISVAFKIPNTLSGTYDIFLVTNPIWMSVDNLASDNIDPRPYRFYTYMIERNTSGNDMGLYTGTGTRLTNPDGSGSYFVTKGFVWDEEKDIPVVNDTTYIGKYEFKHAYYGRNDEGALIQFQSQVTSKLTKDYSREMLISSILLKPHDDSKGDIIVVTPEANEVKALKRKNIKITNKTN